MLLWKTEIRKASAEKLFEKIYTQWSPSLPCFLD